MAEEKFSFYKEYPKRFSPDDFWSQVKRTIGGVPVTQDQIDLIVDAVLAELRLANDDTLLDLCCGNGALSALLFRRCRGGLGVDFSEYLVSIANRYFARPPDETYVVQDAVDFCERPTRPDRFTKMLCYGSFSFIEHDRAESMLVLLKKSFPNLERVFIGNCPDAAQRAAFFGERPIEPGVENDPDSAIGIWRTQEEFLSMAVRCGWRASIHKMPSRYYAAHYRYDVILSR